MPNDPSRTTRAAVLAIFFLSGVSGLVYQVTWVREFGNVFGNTIASASLVTGVFMAGLGAGGYVLGRAGDRRFKSDPAQPLRMYAYAELAIASLGLGLALLLPRLGALSAAVSSYTQGAHGWNELSAGSYALRYAIGVTLLAPATFLMGGTLTLLIRFLVAQNLRSAALRIGLLYGANTAGAALGALVTDFALVPWLGIFGTQLVAVTINAGAGVVALGLARGAVGGVKARARDLAPSGPGEPLSSLPSLSSLSSLSSRMPLTVGHGRAPLLAMAVALGLSGFAAMGLEILWFRVLSGVLGELRSVFSLLLAVILTGIWAGALGGAWLHRRFGRPALLLLCAQCLLCATTLALLGLLDHRGLAREHTDQLKAAFGSAPAWGQVLLELWSTLRPIALAVGLPSLLMGMSFPLANAAVQRAEESVGGRAGFLYLAMTAGNVLGCFLVGFGLLPALGTQVSALILAASAAASALPLYVASRLGDGPGAAAGPRPELVLAAAGGASVIAIAGFASLPGDWMRRASLPYGDQDGTQAVLAASEGLNETLAVVQMPGFRELFTNGHPMSSTHPRSQRYMRAFAHVPLLQLDEPERVLVICFGVGSTLHAASLHPSVQRLEIADLSSHVLDQAPWFAASNQDVLADRRVSVFVNDGRHHLVMQAEGAYDLITLEPPPIAFAGVSALYSKEFYELARSRLKPTGFLTQWLPAYQVREEAVRSAVRAFVEVFPESVLLSGDASELVLMGTRGPSIKLDPAAVAHRLEGLPAVQADLERVLLGDLKELAGTFAASHATMVAASREAAPVTDDRPALEYGLRSQLRERRMPGDLFDVGGVDAFCPGCRETVPGLADYLQVRRVLYASDSFLATQSDRAAPIYLPSTPRTRDAIEQSPYLQCLLGGQGAVDRRAGVEHLRSGRVQEALEAFERATFEDPASAESYEWLGVAREATGDEAGAATALERAVTLGPGRASARFELASVLRALGRAEAAIEHYRKGLELDPLDTDARYELLTVLNAAGRGEEAETGLAAILALDPTHPRANLVLCKRAAAKGDLAGAARFCELAESGGAEVPVGLRDTLRRAAHP